MNVSIYSRKAVEAIISEGKFPENTAVISFHDPASKHSGKDYSCVDYSSVCDDVFHSEADDLDLDYLPEKGYTYDTFFPDADEMAAFIVEAFMSGKNIICQCEYGQSRSAGCAAAILEYFYGKGITVFADYDYYPNQVIFHKVYDALVKINTMYSNTLYSHDTHEKLLDFTTGATTLYSKKRLENDECYHSLEEAYHQLRHGKAKVYVSFHIDNAKVCHGRQMGEHNVGVAASFKYADKEMQLIIYIPKLIKYTKPNGKDYYSGKKQNGVVSLGRFKSVSLDIYGIMELDFKEPLIEKAIITNIAISDD